MANREHFNEYSSALDHNVEMAQATLTSIFNSFTSDMSARDIKKNLRELYPALVREYGDRAAQVALEYYESERTAYLEETNQDDDLYAPGIPNGVPLTYLRKDVSEICKHYHAKNQIENVYTALLGAASNRIMKMSDSTLAYAMKGDRLRPKWALVSRLLSCSWCSMISSFGFHYNSAYNVEKARHKPNPTACRCSVCVDFNHDDPHLKGYDPDKMYYRFSAIADKLGIDFTRENQANSKARKRILAAYEKSQRKSRKVNARINKVADSLGIKVVDGKATNAADKKLLFSELKLRDRQWLLTGKPPEVDYENELAKKNAHGHEIEQAKRLSKQGIKCTFQVDYEVDEKTKGTARQKTIGKTDLVNGIELKSLSGTKNLRKRIEKELRNSRDKKGFKSCHFDAYGTGFDKKEISKALKDKMKQVHIRRSSFIGSDGQYHVVQVNK
ncbi:hypothetical protein ACNF5H_03600 [Fannyhessea vaginae]|uniref:VG15 protein n=1 Tax=Fannyhessea vaginae TaxID=82135 RepID=UPI003A80006E